MTDLTLDVSKGSEESCEPSCPWLVDSSHFTDMGLGDVPISP